VRGGVPWRTGRDNLPDEVPRRSPVERLRISIAIRPLPKGDGRRRSARGTPWLSLRGDYSGSGGGCLFVRETKRTPRRERGGRAACQGSSSPTGSARARSCPSCAGEATGVRSTDSTSGDSRPAVGMLTEDHLSAHGASTHPPRTRTDWAEHPRNASQSLSGGQAQARGGRSRQTVHQAVRSQPGRAPRGAEERTEVGDVPTEPVAAGVSTKKYRGVTARGSPHRTMSRGTGGDSCPDGTDG
jgi:hypothetical protein